MNVVATLRKKTSSRRRSPRGRLEDRPFVPMMKCPQCGGPPKKGRKPPACFLCQRTGYVILPGEIADALSRERGGAGVPRHAQIRANRLLLEMARFPHGDAEDEDEAA